MARPSEILDQLLHQHTQLRTLMQEADAALARIEAGQLRDVALLTKLLDRIQRDLEHHNQSEEQLLPELLRGTDAFGEIRIDRMQDEHKREHAHIRELLRTAAAAVTPRDAVGPLQQLLAELREHIDEEERHFLNARVLRDDPISLEPMGG